MPLCSSSSTILTWPSFEAKCNPLSPFCRGKKEQSRPHSGGSIMWYHTPQRSRSTRYPCYCGDNLFWQMIRPIVQLDTETCEALINADDAESDSDEGWDGRLVVSPPGRIQAVRDRSNLTQPSFIVTGHVRLDLSHITNIIPLWVQRPLTPSKKKEETNKWARSMKNAWRHYRDKPAKSVDRGRCSNCIRYLW